MSSQVTSYIKDGKSTTKTKKGKLNLDPELRRLVMERDGNHCRCCGTSVNLAAHHIRYRSEGDKNGLGGHREENLITLCNDICHPRMHSNKRYWQPILIHLMKLHYESGMFFNVITVENMSKNASEPDQKSS